MTSHVSSTGEPPPRKKRKGVPCCAECRRRKVRCVFENGQSKCNECIFREINCIIQEPNRNQPNSPEDTDSLRRFFQTLEGTFHQVLQSHPTPSATSTSSGRVPATARTFPSLPPVTSPEANGLRSQESRLNERIRNSSNSHVTSGSQDHHFDDAPLLSLFKDVDQPDGQRISVMKEAINSHSMTGQQSHTLQYLKVNVPNVRDLTRILESNHHLWVFWQRTFPEDLDWGVEQPKDKRVTMLQNWFYASLHSDDLARIVKVILCLTLQLQQLPLDFTFDPEQDGHVYSPTVMQDYYMTTVGSLLQSDDGLAKSLDGLECMLLQCEFFINFGNMRKVWMITRHGITLAQLLGLHQESTGQSPRLQSRRNFVWQQLWQMDRGFSLILGLPHAVPEYHCLGPAERNGSLVSAEEHFLCRVGIIAGHIVDRNQDRRKLTYSTTLSIDEELEECRGMMPHEWWEALHDIHSCSEQTFQTFAAKMRFLKVRKLLHLPFMLKSYTNQRYNESRLNVLECAREMITAYGFLRDEKRPVLKRCDMADFEVFSAALILLIDLLGQSCSQSAQEVSQYKKDWQMIQSATLDLQRSSRFTTCKVAAQGAKVLEDLSKAYHGDSVAESRDIPVLEIDIPFFGKVSIRRSRKRDQQQESSPNAQRESMQQNLGHRLEGQQVSQDEHAAESEESAFNSIGEPFVSPDSSFYPYTESLEVQSRQEGGNDQDWMSTPMVEGWKWFPNGDELGDLS